MPKFLVQVCFEEWHYYNVIVEAPNEDSIDHDAAIELASNMEEPDKVDGNGAEITNIEEISDKPIPTIAEFVKSILPE